MQGCKKNKYKPIWLNCVASSGYQRILVLKTDRNNTSTCKQMCNGLQNQKMQMSVYFCSNVLYGQFFEIAKSQ